MLFIYLFIYSFIHSFILKGGKNVIYLFVYFSTFNDNQNWIQKSNEIWIIQNEEVEA
jgi:hypothetical protein